MFISWRTASSLLTTPLKNDVFIIQGCFWDVLGRFEGYFGEMCLEVFGTCLGGFSEDVEQFLDSFREGF